MKSLLDNGCIPPNTECPFKEQCGMSQCHHLGLNSRFAFSCAAARAYDTIKRNEEI